MKLLCKEKTHLATVIAEGAAPLCQVYQLGRAGQSQHVFDFIGLHSPAGIHFSNRNDDGNIYMVVDVLPYKRIMRK